MAIRVLLVDDEQDFLRLLAMRLRSRQLEVSSAHTGETALAWLAKNDADIVVLDIRMPGMDGLETLRHIKSRYPQTRVIMLTGFADAAMVDRVLEDGAAAYLMKPIDIDELLSKIHQAHEGSSGPLRE